jgi:methyl-accepting chemotaxis protein
MTWFWRARAASVPNYPQGVIAVSDAGTRARLDFMGMTPEILGVVAHYRGDCQAATDGMVDAFYARVGANPVTRAILDKHTTIERQRPILTRYVLSMFEGRIDDAYVQHRQRVGQVHSRIDLDSNWFVAMYETIRSHIVGAVRASSRRADELEVFRSAFERVLQLDIALVVDALANTRRGEIEAMNRGNERVIVSMTHALEAMSAQDLTARMHGEFAGAHAELQTTFNTTLAALDAAFHGIQDASRDIARASDQISASASSVAAGACNQRAALDTVIQQTEQLTSLADRTAATALQLRDQSAEASSVAREGTAELDRLGLSLQSMTEAADETAQIVRTIDEIAFQTNLLALNASVEAARAGDAGRAFGVVAEEVRMLATRAASAARRTTHLIQQARTRAHASTELSTHVSGSLDRVLRHIEGVHVAIAELTDNSTAQREISVVMQQHIVRIGDVTQENAAAAEQSAAASTELAGQSTSMEHTVGAFRLSKVEAPARPPRVARHSPARGLQAHR